MTVYPWDGWYHGIASTHGSWIRGDDRGWRSRHHREHVEGDYKHRPPRGTYDEQKKQSLTAMTRPAVCLTMPQRRIVCAALAEKLQDDDVELAALVVTATHAHVLARYPNHENPGMAMPGLSPHNRARRGAAMIDPAPRHYLGRARKHAAHTLRDHGPTQGGALWMP